MTRYRTIVADPPWPYKRFVFGTGHLERGNKGNWHHAPLPYAAMTVDEIRALPVRRLADDHCRLFLWTTNRYLPKAFGVLDAWGFEYRQTLVWHKTTINLPAHIAPNSAEYLLVAVKGSPERLSTFPVGVIATARGGSEPQQHSIKPDCWLDWIERTSPPPRAELFARRARFGWDYPIGDQALGGVAA